MKDLIQGTGESDHTNWLQQNIMEPMRDHVGYVDVTDDKMTQTAQITLFHRT